MSTLSPKAQLHDTLESSNRWLADDFAAIPADKMVVSPGGAGRTPISIVAECADLNRIMATRLETGAFPERRSPEDREAFLDTFDTPEKALAFLDEETRHLLRVVDGLDDATFANTLMHPLGMETTVFGLAEFAALHMMYHDGQLNYIHSLYGDSAMHWR